MLDQKTLTIAIAACILSGGLGVLGGATLKPTCDTSIDAYVHQVSFSRMAQSDPAEMVAYVTLGKHLADGGMRMRDVGGRVCATGNYGAKLLASLDAACVKVGWLHVVELRYNGTDGGILVNAYGSHTKGDAGVRVDDGHVACEVPSVQDVTDGVFQEAMTCVTPILSEL